MSGTLRVELLGRLRVVRGGEVTTRFETRRTAALLAILALSLPRACSRESLLEHLWPDEDPEATRPRLRQSLSVLRGILNAPGSPPALVTDREEVRLDPSRVTTDLADFQAAVEAARRSAAPADKRTHLEAALRLAGGELLPGASEDVILAARDRQAESYRGALISFADLLREMGDYAAAIEAGQQAVTADPCDEQAHLALIRAYSADGQTVEAIRRARDMERTLREELDAAPSEATRAFVGSLRAPASRPAAPAVSPPAPPSRPTSDPPGDAPTPAGARRPPWTRTWVGGVIAGGLLLGAAVFWPRSQGPEGDSKKVASGDYTLDDFLLGQRTKSGFERAIKRDSAALKTDPHDAAASVSEAEAYALMGYYGYIDSREATKRAGAGANEALHETVVSSKTKAGALSCLGWVALGYRHDWKTAMSYFDRAKLADPDYAPAYQRNSLALMLQGRQTESIAEIVTAQQKDEHKLSFIIGTSVGGRSYYGRQYASAIAQYTMVLNDNPDYAVAYFWRGLAYAKVPGQRQKTEADLSEAVTLSDRAPLFLAFQGQDWARIGQRKKALRVLDELRRRRRTEYVDPVCLAVLDTGLGDRATAFSLLDEAVRENDGALILLEEAAPAFDFLASDPRYVSLRARMHLPPRVPAALTKISR